MYKARNDDVTGETYKRLNVDALPNGCLCTLLGALSADRLVMVQLLRGRRYVTWDRTPCVNGAIPVLLDPNDAYYVRFFTLFLSLLRFGIIHRANSLGAADERRCSFVGLSAAR